MTVSHCLAHAVPSIDRDIYLALYFTASSTDAAAELISSESMTKSLWKHFYLCVCLCGELRGPLAGLPLRLS